jgi:hypothetical protein
VVRPTSVVATITESGPGKNGTKSIAEETSTTKWLPSDSAKTTPGYEQPTVTKSGSYQAPSKPAYLAPFEDNVVQAAAIESTSAVVEKAAASSTTASSTTEPAQITNAAGRATSGLGLMTAAFAVFAFFL